MSPPARVELPEALERAARSLRADADAIRPANGDPLQLLELLEEREAASRVLAWLLEHETDAGAELALAWAEAERGAAPVLGVAEEGLSKVARKALRRARHRLRSRGVAEAEARPPERVAKLARLEEPLERALVSPLDPGGARMVYLARGHPSGGARLFEIVVDDTRGVVEFEVYDTGRRRVRRFLAAFTARERYPGIEVPPEAAAALLARVVAAQPAGRPQARGFSEWRSKIAAPGPDARPPGALARDGLAPAEDPAAARERAAQLVRERAIGPWPPALEALQPIAEQIEELEKSPIIVSGARRRERLEEILERAQVELFVGDFGAITADRFDETAFVLWKQERDEDARACLAAADGLRGGAIGRDPVARAILEVTFAPLLGRLEGDEAREGGDAAEPAEEREPSLLVRPR